MLRDKQNRNIILLFIIDLPGDKLSSERDIIHGPRFPAGVTVLLFTNTDTLKDTTVR